MGASTIIGKNAISFQEILADMKLEALLLICAGAVLISALVVMRADLQPLKKHKQDTYYTCDYTVH